MPSPDKNPTVFTSQEQLLIWQGVQKLINEAEEHRSTLLKGFQCAALDPNSQTISEYYGKRMQICKDIQGKLPQLAHFTVTDKTAGA